MICFIFEFFPLTHQRLQLFVVREVELGDKVIEMLVAGVDVSLSPHLAHAVKVVDVDVNKHPEQTRQNLLSHLHEGLREGSTCESDRWRRPGSMQGDLLLPHPQRQPCVWYLVMKRSTVFSR